MVVAQCEGPREGWFALSEGCRGWWQVGRCLPRPLRPKIRDFVVDGGGGGFYGIARSRQRFRSPELRKDRPGGPTHLDLRRRRRARLAHRIRPMHCGGGGSGVDGQRWQYRSITGVVRERIYSVDWALCPRTRYVYSVVPGIMKEGLRWRGL